MKDPVIKMLLGNALFWCEACDDTHGVLVGIGGWIFNNDLITPTLAPSITIVPPVPGKPKCHFVIEKGLIRYLPDSEHIFAGDVLVMRPIFAWPANRTL